MALPSPHPEKTPIFLRSIEEGISLAPAGGFSFSIPASISTGRCGVVCDGVMTALLSLVVHSRSLFFRGAFPHCKLISVDLGDIGVETGFLCSENRVPAFETTLASEILRSSAPKQSELQSVVLTQLSRSLI